MKIVRPNFLINNTITMTLEQLLNSLIEKGWKPFGSNYGRYEHGCLIHEFTTKDGVYSYGQYPTTLREFCAKESLLRQFVCENGMVRLETDSGENDSYLCYYNDDGYPKDYFFEMGRDDYRFRLIESALKDESELESFILDNIKIEGQQHKQ